MSDPGPQKGPSSVARIMAQQKVVEADLKALEGL